MALFNLLSGITEKLTGQKYSGQQLKPTKILGRIV
jgi:hypothetical protein